MHQFPDLPSAAFARRFQHRLLTWFAKHRRNLPWRGNRDAYRIWVSEVMLQQTQVATVVPYFRRFLRAFPTLQSLAAASEAAVFREWEGLGYYRRARDLHRAARLIRKDHHGRIPRDPAVLARLPGIGRYMVGAVLSQAFGARLPILEANSVRVLSRVLACPDDPRTGPVRRRLWEVAERLLPAKGVGDFNQALMELGALVCTARRPKCTACPVIELCAARAAGIQDELPRRAPAVPPTGVAEIAVALIHQGKVLLVQRPPNGRWASFWEFPHGAMMAGESPERAVRRLLRQLTGLRGRVGPVVATIRHGVTRFRIVMSCFRAEYLAGEFQFDFYRRCAWVSPRRCAAYPMPAAMRRLAELI